MSEVDLVCTFMMQNNISVCKLKIYVVQTEVLEFFLNLEIN